jgi:hypothetical protein
MSQEQYQNTEAYAPPAPTSTPAPVSAAPQMNKNEIENYINETSSYWAKYHVDAAQSGMSSKQAGMFDSLLNVKGHLAVVFLIVQVILLLALWVFGANVTSTSFYLILIAGAFAVVSAYYTPNFYTVVSAFWLPLTNAYIITTSKKA